MKEKDEPRVWAAQTYDRLANYYDIYMKVFYPVGEKGRKHIAGKLIAGKSVLDVACGTGTLLEMASQKGLRCYGIDLSAGMLAQARKKLPEVELQQAGFYEIPYPAKSFDYVVATNALSATFVDPGKVISEMIRVCKKGGEVYIAEWPSVPQDNRLEKLLLWLARLSDDEPKDYLALFRERGYEPEVDQITKRYHVFGIKKNKKN